MQTRSRTRAQVKSVLTTTDTPPKEVTPRRRGKKECQESASKLEEEFTPEIISNDDQKHDESVGITQEPDPGENTIEQEKEISRDEIMDDNNSKCDPQEESIAENLPKHVEVDDDEEDELELLLKKAEESLRIEKSTLGLSVKEGNRKHLTLPKLNAGFCVDDQLYIKTNQDGISSLRHEEVGIQNRSLKNNSDEKKPEIPESTKLNNQAPKLSKKEKKKLREATAGPGWFDMPKVELTPEVKRDLQVIKLRNVLDPKRFYRKDNSKNIPKYFQVGTIIEGPTEFYSSRLPRKERKRTIVDELMADDQAKKYYKRKFSEIQEAKQSGGRKHYSKLRKKRKNN